MIPEHDLVFVRFGRSDPYREWSVLFEDLAHRVIALDEASPLAGSVERDRSGT